MNTNLTLASVLRITADSEGLPEGFTSKVLHAVADGLEQDEEGIHVVLAPCGAGCSPAATAAPSETAGAATTAAASDEASDATTETSYVDLEEEDENGEPNLVQAGDEWKLKDGFKHKDRSRPVEWRVVTEDLVGREVGEFEKSVFRRPV